MFLLLCDRNLFGFFILLLQKGSEIESIWNATADSTVRQAWCFIKKPSYVITDKEIFDCDGFGATIFTKVASGINMSDQQKFVSSWS